MQILETKVYPLDGVKVTLFTVDPGTVGVAMVDTDADDAVIAVRRWSHTIPDARQRAYKYFDELVRKCNLAGDM